MSRYILKNTESKDIVVKWLKQSMLHYAKRSSWAFADEDSLCEAFLSAVSGHVDTPTGRFSISGYKVRGRGRAAPEKKLGADGIGIFSLNTVEVSLSGFFLYQVKKTKDNSTKLVDVCSQSKDMLSHCSASQVMVLMPETVVFTGAMAVAALKAGEPSLANLPYNSFPQFIGEQMLRGLMLAPFNDLKAIRSRDLLTEVKHILAITASEEGFLERAERRILREISELNLDIEDIG